MAPTHRINKPMKSEKTTCCYCFAEPLLPLPQGERVNLPAKRLAWGLSPGLPAAWPVCLSGEHMLFMDHHCFVSRGPSLPLERLGKTQTERGHHNEGQNLEGRETSGLVKKGREF